MSPAHTFVLAETDKRSRDLLKQPVRLELPLHIIIRGRSLRNNFSRLIELFH